MTLSLSLVLLEAHSTGLSQTREERVSVVVANLSNLVEKLELEKK